jgi:hypothetical protein
VTNEEKCVAQSTNENNKGLKLTGALLYMSKSQLQTKEYYQFLLNYSYRTFSELVASYRVIRSKCIIQVKENENGTTFFL